MYSFKAFPDEVSLGEKYGPAMTMKDQAEAQAYFDHLVAHQMRSGVSRARAEEIERSNLGYYAGYYNDETRARVEALFRCEHPVFGSIAEKGPPSLEEAFKLGVEMGKKSKAKRKK